MENASENVTLWLDLALRVRTQLLWVNIVRSWYCPLFELSVFEISVVCLSPACPSSLLPCRDTSVENPCSSPFQTVQLGHDRDHCLSILLLLSILFWLAFGFLFLSFSQQAVIFKIASAWLLPPHFSCWFFLQSVSRI